MPAAPGELFEAGDDRIRREAPAREREVGRDRAVAMPEPQHAVGSEARRSAATAVEQPFELGPGRCSVPQELV